MTRGVRVRRNPALAGVPVIGYALENPIQAAIAAGLIWWAINPQAVRQFAAANKLPVPPLPPPWLGQFTNPQPATAPPAATGTGR